MRKSLLPLTVAALLALGGAGSSAQELHDAHHPPEAPAQAPGTQAQPAAPGQDNRSPAMGMMGGPGMMGAGGMMPMMGMMMGREGMGMPDMAMPGMDMADRIEGRIAFLRTELKITDAQTRVWNAFADALRGNSKRLNELRMAASSTAGASRGLAAQIDRQERWYGARLDGIRAIGAAFKPLYAALSPDQQKAADQIMAPHLGLMPMGMMWMGPGMEGGMQMDGMPMQAPRR